MGTKKTIEMVRDNAGMSGVSWDSESSPLIVAETCRLAQLRLDRLLDLVSLTRELLDNEEEALAMQLMNMCFGDRPTWRGVCAESFAIKIADATGNPCDEKFIHALILDTKFKMTPMEWEKTLPAHPKRLYCE